MKLNFISSLITGLSFLAGPVAVNAQDDGFKVIPVELFTFSYNEGKGSSDLDAAVDKWDAWADKQGHKD